MPKPQNALNGVFGSKYRIPLDHEILGDRGAFYPRALTESLTFEITLAPAGQVFVGKDSTCLGNELSNLELEYEAVRNADLARETANSYCGGKMFFYDHETLHKTLTVSRGADSIVNETVNVPRRSMKGLLILFVEPYAAGARDSEKFVSPGISSVRVAVEGMPNKVYSQGLMGRDLWEEAARHFVQDENENSDMDVTRFHTENKFRLFVDLRSTEDTILHGAGLRLVNSKDGVQLEIRRASGGSGNLNCHVFVIADAQFNLLNGQLDSIQY